MMTPMKHLKLLAFVALAACSQAKAKAPEGGDPNKYIGTSRVGMGHDFTSSAAALDLDGVAGADLIEWGTAFELTCDADLVFCVGMNSTNITAATDGDVTDSDRSLTAPGKCFKVLTGVPKEKRIDQSVMYERVDGALVVGANFDGVCTGASVGQPCRLAGDCTLGGTCDLGFSNALRKVQGAFLLGSDAGSCFFEELR